MKRKLALVITVIVTAFAGLLGVQFLLLQDAFELKQQAFHQNVAGALSVTALRLATAETMTALVRIDTESTSGMTELKWERQRRDTNVFISRSETSDPLRMRGDSVFFTIATPQRLRIQRYDSGGRASILLDTIKQPGEHTFSLKMNGGERRGFFYRFNTDSVTMLVQVQDSISPRLVPRPANERERAVLVSRVIDNLWVSEQLPLEKRVSRATLDSVIRRSMREAGVPLEFWYGVLDARDSVHLASPPAAAEQLRASTFRAPLFLAAGPLPTNDLVVTFPGETLYLLQQLWPVLLASGLFLGLLMAGFGVVIWTIRRQQQLASSMVEFINNMTHEFKTPLSTVKLAAEAIQRHDVIVRKTKVLQYNRMVAEEAQRMKRQVDRILDLAQLEEGDVELSFSRVDLHALLSEASRTFAMQVEARGGRLTLRRDAASATVQGDPVHLLNILHSLLDNANKYSPDAPDILVATANEGDLVVITIADRGIGIPADHQKRVFEKYYRVPTGKLHDVKGFGIGLSYVKLMVEAHHGTVQLQSHPGRGTTVVLRLPVTTP